MTRGGVLLAVALTLVLTPATAAGQTGSQPDLMIVNDGRGTTTGDDTYGDGVGQQRSVIVDDRVVLTIRLENDGAEREDYGLHVHVMGGDEDAFLLRYRLDDSDISKWVTSRRVSLRVAGVAPGDTRDVHLVVRALDDAPLGSELRLNFYARPPRHGVGENDNVNVEITKTSTPPSTLTAV